MQTSPIRILFLKDTKPGHYLRTEGIVAAIQKVRPVVERRLTVRRRPIVASRMLQHALNLNIFPAAILKLGYGIDSSELPPADLVVSAGGDTLAANAAAALLLGVPNIFYGRLRRVSPRSVRVVIVPYEKYEGMPNHVIALPPSAIEPSQSTTLRKRFSPTNPPAVVGVLIGGNTGTVRYQRGDWERLTRFLREAHNIYGIRWIVTTSRRSDTTIVEALTRHADERENGIDRLFIYGQGDAGAVPTILAAADTILVTDDSTSMISEAVAACRPVIGLRPQVCNHEQEEEEFRAFVSNRGWYRPLDLAQLTADRFLNMLGGIIARDSSALEELGSTLARRLPDVFEGRQT